MITYEVKLKKIGEMTTIPDSQRLFGFLINSSKKCCTEDEISIFVKGVKENKEKCMISNLMPTGYYPTPKAFILQNLECKLAENQEKIKEYEKEQNELNIESKSIVKELISKNFIAETTVGNCYFINPDYIFNGDRLSFVQSYIKTKTNEIKSVEK